MNKVLLIGLENDQIVAGIEKHLLLLQNEVIRMNYASFFSSKISLSQFNGTLSGEIVKGKIHIDLDSLQGLFVSSPNVVLRKNNQSKNSQFIDSESTGLLRYLLFHVSCNVINRIRPEYWNYNFVHFNVVRKIKSIKYAEKINTVHHFVIANYSDSTQLGNPRATFHAFPFTEMEESLEIVNDSGKIKTLTSVIPLRFYGGKSNDIVDVYIVNSKSFFSNPPNEKEVFDHLRSKSVLICQELGLTFAQVRWLLLESGVVNLGVSLIPDLTLLDDNVNEIIFESIAKELIK